MALKMACTSLLLMFVLFAQATQGSEDVRKNRIISWDTFYSHSEINEYLNDVLESHPDLVAIYNAALTSEGRQIQYARISTTRFESMQKPVIIVTALISGREWASGSAALYLINQLVENVDSRLTNEADWIIIPVVNADGYEYSRIEDREWTKTRSKSNAVSDECVGVNAEYNFDTAWGTDSENADPCSDTYEGSATFSEPESRLIRDVIWQHQPRVSLYINLRSQRNQVLYSWSNNGTLPSNGLALHLAGVQIANAMGAVAADADNAYIVGNAGTVRSTATGSPLDFARASEVLYAYDISTAGYVIEPENILQVAKEAWAGIAAAAHHILAF